MKERYFIVFFQYATKNGLIRPGRYDLETVDEYPSQYHLSKMITENTPEVKQLVFTNVIELSFADFQDWQSK